MSNQGFRRSFRTPAGYSQTPSGRMAQFNQVYLAYVKSTEDAFRMGRLKVWIPEFSSNPDDSSNWFTVQYCSPMAGATNHLNNIKEGKTLADTQQSYGWWAVPPDLENEVVVMFLNGDPNRGIYIGGMYQPFMNHMVPGIPTGTSFDSGSEGIDPPVAEYNRWDPNIPNSDNHTRARFDPLHEGLAAQGLYIDPIRGPSNAGARRDSVSKVYGFKSPEGHHMVFDDSDEGFIRFRTRSGAQILINDATGYVYFISGNGNSWFEISDDGIDGYSANSISLRSQGDMNLHADGNVNIHAGGSLNTFSGSNTSVQAGGRIDLQSGSTTNISSGGSLNFMTKGSLAISSSGSSSVKSGSSFSISSSGAIGVASNGNIFLTGSEILQNSGKGPAPETAAEASVPKSSTLADRELDSSNGYPEATTQSIVSRLPTHEPWAGHPGSKSSSVSRSLGGSSYKVGAAGAGDEVDVDNSVVVPDDGKKFAMPVSGIGTSNYGRRPRPTAGASSMHGGIDIGARTGTPVHASKGGVVTFAGSMRGYGNIIIIDHGKGVTTRYAHLSAFNVSRGSKVNQMQVIGKVGNTGVGTGPHLHFEIRNGGATVNPAKYVPFQKGRPTKAGSQL